MREMSVNAGFEEIARTTGAAAAAAVAEAAAAAAGEQLELLGLAPPIRSIGQAADQVRAQIAEAARVRGRGRPPGAQNKITQDAKRWITRVVGDPLIESARWLLHTPASMAKELDCTVLEAFGLQQRIREGLLPYLHAKLAPVGEDGRPLPLFQLIMGAGAEGVDGGDLAPWLGDPEVRRTLEHENEQNQGVSGDEADQSQTAAVAK
jgi:hypothetical protein